jgi:GAF domain-containing protein
LPPAVSITNLGTIGCRPPPCSSLSVCDLVDVVDHVQEVAPTPSPSSTGCWARAAAERRWGWQRGDRLEISQLLAYSGGAGLNNSQYRLLTEIPDLVSGLLESESMSYETAPGRRPMSRRGMQTTSLDTRTVADLARAVSSALELDSVLHHVTNATIRLCPEALCIVRLVDAAAGGYRLAAISGGTADGRVPLIPFGRGLTHTVVGSRRPLIIRDIRADPSAVIQDASALDGRTAYYGVPIQAGQELFGVLSVCFAEPARPTAEEQEIIEILAGHAAVAIRNAHLFSASEARRRAAEALAEVSRVLSQSLEPAEVAQRIVTTVRTILHARSASVFRLDATTGALIPVASSADAGPTWGGHLPKGCGVGAIAVRDRVPVSTADVLTDERIALTPEVRSRLEKAQYRSILALPLMVQGNVIGTLVVRDERGRRFEQESIAVAEAFADQAALAFHNARLYEDSLRRRRVAEHLADVAKMLTQSPNVEDLAAQLVDKVRQIFRVGAARIDRRQGDGALLLLASAVSTEASSSIGDRILQGMGLFACAVNERRPVWSADVLNDSRVSLTDEMRRWIGETGYRAVMAVPLLVNAEVVGTLTIADPLGRTFDDTEIQLAEAFADQAALALEKARLYDAAERERQRLSVLYGTARQLVAAPNTEEVLSKIVEESARLLKAEAGCLRLLEGDELVVRAETGATAVATRSRIGAREGLSATVVMTGRPLAVEDLAADIRYHSERQGAASEPGCESFLGVPLKANDRILGTLNIFTRANRRFSDDDIALLSALADQAAIALIKEQLVVERQCSEEALRQNEKLASMGQLLAGVAHELNNPLSVIIGSVHLLRAHVTSDAARRGLARIADAGQRCARVVKMFLSLSRKQPATRERVNLNAVVDRALELLESQLRVTDIGVVRSLDANLPEPWGDPHQLLEVVLNLASNARDAMLESRGRRELRVATRFKPNVERVTVEISDTGPGIPPEVQRQIFDPFFTTKQVGQGTGLGLAVCHSIIERHKGTIRVVSQPGAGATFSVELPLGSRADATPGPQPSPTPIQTHTAKRILVIDDETDVAATLSDTLSADGHEVETAENGQVALAKLREQSFDVILSDIKMPVLDGIRFYREIQASHPGLCRRIVFVTGDVLSPETNEFLKTTAVRSLSKPFLLEDLQRVIQA